MLFSVSGLIYALFRSFLDRYKSRSKKISSC